MLVSGVNDGRRGFASRRSWGCGVVVVVVFPHERRGWWLCRPKRGLKRNVPWWVWSGTANHLFLVVVVAEISPVFEISELPTFVCPNHLLQSPWTLLFEVFDLVFLVLNFLTLYTVYVNVDMVYTKN